MVALDDFHHFASEPVSALLSRLVQYRPENLHLMISTRVDPPLPLVRWRVSKWLVEIRASELRFFKEEAQAFFAPLAGPMLSDETVEMIFNRTEGWVAGIQMARLSLASAENRESFARSFSGSDRNSPTF